MNEIAYLMELEEFESLIKFSCLPNKLCQIFTFGVYIEEGFKVDFSSSFQVGLRRYNGCLRSLVLPFICS